MNITWSCKAFDALTPHELYSILQLRNKVFIVEQNCVYPDCDDKDQLSYHLMGWLENELVAYTRLIPAGVVYDELSIGRVVTSASVRGTKTGKELILRSIDKLRDLYGENDIKIGAQFYLKRFYESLGFIQCSDIYLEDGIEHIKMIRK